MVYYGHSSADTDFPEATVKYNLGRNKYEKYNGIIKETYNKIFLIETNGIKVNMTVVYVILVFLIIIIVGYFVYSYIKKIYENRNKF